MPNDRTLAISKVHPIVFRGSDLVMAWIFTATLQQGDQQAMDTATIELDPSERKLLAEWTRGEVDALIQSAVAAGPNKTPVHPRLLALHRVLDTRLTIEERMDFDLGSLPA